MSAPGFHHTILAPDEVAVERGIPVTTIARTLFDVAPVAPAKFERAATEAELRRLGGGASLEALAARHPRKRGVVAVRALLAAGRVGAGITRSELERHLRALLGA